MPYKDLDPYQMLSEVAEGDIIEVKFLDASHTRNVRKITNKVVATYKKVIGRFIGIVLDKLYAKEHVLLSNLETDGEYMDVFSIPLDVIVRIEVLKESKTLKEANDVGMPYLAGGKDVKLVLKHEGIGRTDSQ